MITVKDFLVVVMAHVPERTCFNIKYFFPFFSSSLFFLNIKSKYMPSWLPIRIAHLKFAMLFFQRDGENFSKIYIFSCILNFLSTKLARDHIGRISALSFYVKPVKAKRELSGPWHNGFPVQPLGLVGRGRDGL